jgi:hypothetical protein
MNHGRKFAFCFLLLSILMLPRFVAAQAKQPAILQVQNNGTTAGTAANFFRINFTTGCTTTFASGVFSVACTGGAGNPGGSANQIQYNNAGSSFGAFTMTGDCSIVVATGVITCTKSSGTAFGSLATLATGTAAQFPVVNSGATAAVYVSLTSDCTMTSTGAITCTKTNGTAFGTLATATSYSSVAALWAGCSGTQYLGYDGNCHTASGSPASPSLSMQGNNAGAFFAIPGTAFNTTNGVTEFEIYGPRPWIDLTAYGADPTGVADSATAFNNALSACSGGTILVPPGSYKFLSQISASTACTLKAQPGTATLTQAFNSGTTTTSGLILVSGSNVNLIGLTILGNSGINTGRVVTVYNASTQVAHTKIQNVSITGCDKTCLRIDGVNDFELASSRLQAVNTEYPLYIQSTNNSLQDVRIHDNIIDGTSIVNGNHGALELTAAGTHIDIGPNNVIYGGDWYGAEIGLFYNSTTGPGVGVLNNFNFHDNHIVGTQANNHGGVSFGGGNSPPCSISHNTVDLQNLATGGGYGLELNGVVACTIDGNVLNLDSTGTVEGIWGDDLNDSTVSHNVVNGFGGSGEIGIGINEAQNQEALTTCSSTGSAPFLVTCSTGTMPPWIFNGGKVNLNGNSPVAYNGNWNIVSRTGTNGSSGTFTFYVAANPGTMTLAGNVSPPSSNNVIADNQVIFPVQGTRSGTLVGIQMRCGIGATTGVCSNNSFRNNTVQGTGASGELGINFTGAGTQDSNSANDNTLINLATGISRSNGTNSQFLNNNFISVATQWAGTAQSGELASTPQYQDYAGQASAPTAPVSPACRWYYNTTTGLMAGINSASGACGPSGGGGPGTGTQYTHPYWSSTSALGSVAPTTGYDGVPQTETNSTTSGVFTAAPTSAPPGVPFDVQSGATPTVALTDRTHLFQTTNNTTSTAVTVPATSTTGFGLNIPFVHCNTGSVIATDTVTTDTINGNAAAVLVGKVSGHNPECMFWWSDNTNYWGAEILPTDANGHLAPEGLPGSGTAAMGTSAISSGACATVVTVAVTGVTTANVIVATPTVDPTGVTGYAPSASGSLYIQAYPTSGNVNFKVCNNTSASITPSALTLNFRVL